MNLQFQDMIIGCESSINLSLLHDNNNSHAFTFKLMTTPDKSSYVITYQYLDALSKTFNDKQEAFYIDNVNDSNRKKAEEIVVRVYSELKEAFDTNPNDTINMEELVTGILEKAKAKQA